VAARYSLGQLIGMVKVGRPEAAMRRFEGQSQFRTSGAAWRAPH
jgi:hypothetical protein